jgi:formin-A
MNQPNVTRIMPPPPPPGQRPMYGGGPQGYGPPNPNVPTGPPLRQPSERYSMSISQTMVPLPNGGPPPPPPGHVRMPPPHGPPFGGPAGARSMVAPSPPVVAGPSMKRPNSAMQPPMQGNF